MRSGGEKLALFYNNLKESPKCPVCGKPCKFLSLRRGWTTACSRRCVGHNHAGQMKWVKNM